MYIHCPLLRQSYCPVSPSLACGCVEFDYMRRFCIMFLSLATRWLHWRSAICAWLALSQGPQLLDLTFALITSWPQFCGSAYRPTKALLNIICANKIWQFGSLTRCQWGTNCWMPAQTTCKHLATTFQPMTVTQLWYKVNAQFKLNVAGKHDSSWHFLWFRLNNYTHYRSILTHLILIGFCLNCVKPVQVNGTWECQLGTPQLLWSQLNMHKPICNLAANDSNSIVMQNQCTREYINLNVTDKHDSNWCFFVFSKQIKQLCGLMTYFDPLNFDWLLLILLSCHR